MAAPIRKTTPFTPAEAREIDAFADVDSPEYAALEQYSPFPLRAGSEGAVVRALAVIGMRYIRWHGGLDESHDAAYAALAASRNDEDLAYERAIRGRRRGGSD